MKIIVGADPLGFALKETIKDYLLKQGFAVEDISKDEGIPYYDVGFEVGKSIANGDFDRGIIFCGSGMGVNLIANKFEGVYCALCESIHTAQLARKINNANILSLGGLIISDYLAKQMVDTFLATPFAFDFSEASPEFLQESFGQVEQREKEITLLNSQRNKLVPH